MSETIAEKLFVNLPLDPLAASFELLERIKNSVMSTQKSEADYTAACGYLEAFYEAKGWKIPDPVAPRQFSTSESIDDAIGRSRAASRLKFEAFQNQIMANHMHVTKALAREALAAATAKTFGYAILDEKEKKEIHKHIEKIRAIIEGSELEDGKKNSLFGRLGALATDVNRNGTRTDRFFAFASEAAFCAGNFANNAKPLFDELKDMLKIVTRARARLEGIKLPPGDEIVSLPSPGGGNG